MRILDRYILRTFITPFLACFSAFVLLYFLYDLFNNMDEFIEAKTPLREVGRYYLYLVPAVLKIILPVTLLMGVLYSLWQLTKSNEVTAMRASGISLPRIVSPFLLVGLLSTGVVGLVEETVAPMAQEWTQSFLRTQDVKRGKEKTPPHLVLDLKYHNPLTQRTWRIARMDRNTMELTKVILTQFQPNMYEEYRISADAVRWENGKWIAYGATVQHFDERGILRQVEDGTGALVAQLRHERLELTGVTETPRHLENEIKPPEQLTSAELKEYLAYHPNLNDTRLANLLTQLQTKRATPWICLVVTLLGVPFGNQTARKGALAGIAMCIGLFFFCYVAINIMGYLGKKGVLNAFVAAWSPLVVFALLAGIMIHRMR